MDKQEFRQALQRNNITCDEFAALIRCSLSTVYDFGGRYPVPHHARLILRLIDERGGVQGLLGQSKQRGSQTG